MIGSRLGPYEITAKLGEGGMGEVSSSLKTTIDLPENLLDEARRAAAARSTTVKALVESGLRRELKELARVLGFRLRDASFAGRGLRPEVAGAAWESLRGLAYGERGG